LQEEIINEGRLQEEHEQIKESNPSVARSILGEEERGGTLERTLRLKEFSLTITQKAKRGRV